MLIEFQVKTCLIGWECLRIGCWGRCMSIRGRKWQEAGWRRWRPLFVCLTKYYLCDKFKENEMGRACGTWRRREMHTGCWWGKLKERDHLEDLGIDGSLVLKWILMLSLNYHVYLNTRWEFLSNSSFEKWGVMHNVKLALCRYFLENWRFWRGSSYMQVNVYSVSYCNFLTGTYNRVADYNWVTL